MQPEKRTLLETLSDGVEEISSDYKNESGVIVVVTDKEINALILEAFKNVPTMIENPVKIFVLVLGSLNGTIHGNNDVHFIRVKSVDDIISHLPILQGEAYARNRVEFMKNVIKNFLYKTILQHAGIQ